MCSVTLPYHTLPVPVMGMVVQVQVQGGSKGGLSRSSGISYRVRCDTIHCFSARGGRNEVRSTGVILGQSSWEERKQSKVK